MKITLLCLIAVVSFSKTCCAYETPTHAFITKEAFDRSVLTVNSTELYARLGFERLNPNQPFETGFPDGCVGPASIFERDSAYVDARGTWLVGSNMPPDSGNVFFRCPLNYERRDMPPEYSGRTRNAGAVPAQPGPTPQLRFEGWLMRGVIREDDLSPADYGTSLDRPDADPWGEQTRVLYHFYAYVSLEHNLKINRSRCSFASRPSVTATCERRTSQSCL